MRFYGTIAIALSAIALASAGCTRDSILTHKLVATGGQHTIPLYSDEATFLKISHKAQQGGISGLVGNAQQDISAKQIDDQTSIKIISSDDNGSEVAIVDGPMKGTAGFAAKQNVE